MSEVHSIFKRHIFLFWKFQVILYKMTSLLNKAYIHRVRTKFQATSLLYKIDIRHIIVDSKTKTKSFRRITFILVWEISIRIYDMLMATKQQRQMWNNTL